MTIEQKAKTGTIWVSIGQFGYKILSLASMIILARLLSPSDFGVVAMAMVSWEIVRLFGNLGIGAALIHEQKDIERFANAAFWMNVFIALVLASATVFIAPFAARFYNNPLVKPILLLFSLGFVFGSLGSVHSTLLTKELEFKKITIANLILSLFRTTAIIVMAFSGAGVWSLVIPNVAFSLINSIVFWKICPWRPAFKIEPYYCREVFNFGKYMFGSDLLRYININADYLIIGKFLGSMELGFYTFAYNLANWPVTNIVWVVTRVAFPTFSKLQDNIPRIKEVFLKMTKVTSLISFPIFCGLIAVANEFVPFVYSAKWCPAILPLQIIIIFAAIRSMGSPGGQVLFAIGRPDKVFKFNLIQAPFLVGGILLGVKYGIIGVSIATALILGIGGCIFLWISARSIGIEYREVLTTVFPAAISSLAIMLALITIKALFPLSGSIQTLLISIMVGLCLYPAIIYIFFNGIFKELLALFKSMFGDLFKVKVKMRFVEKTAHID